MKRKLFSMAEPCKSGCKYCFEKWSTYIKQESFLDSNSNMSECEVIYPSCDGEGLIDTNILELIERIVRCNSKYLIFSISTKSVINIETIERVATLNNELIKNNKGFIKISITITNMSLINEVEPNTGSFSDRIRMLKTLTKYNIPTSVIIKPILPFIDFNEYKDIIDKSSSYTNLFLLGDLYVNEDTEFYNTYIRDKYKIEERKINWLDNTPSWKVVISDNKMKIQKYIDEKGLNYFKSDLVLLEHIKNTLNF